jgi:hypothetical protein
MLSPSAIIWGFVVPALLVAVALGAAWRPWNRSGDINGRWIAAPAIGAAFGIAFWHLQEQPAWPPGNGSVLTWIFYFALCAALLGLLEAIFHPPKWLALVVIVIFWRLAVRTLISPQIPRLISPTAAEMWIDLASITAAVWWLAMESLAERAPGITVPLVLGIIATGTALTLLSWHILISAMLAGAVGTFCGAAFVIAAWHRRMCLGAGGVTALVILLLAVMVHAFFYTPDTFSSSQYALTAILLASPLLALAGDLPGVRNWKPGWRLIARVIPVILAVGTVASVGMRNYLTDQSAGQAAQQDE